MGSAASAGETPHHETLERALLFLAAIVLLGVGLGLRSPWPADEPRFALIARDMVATGHWFFPEVGAELYADKPPLFFWMIASVFWLTGSLRLAFLVPSLISALGTLALVYDLGRRWWNHRVGLYAAAILLSTVQFLVQAHAAQIDMTLCFFTTLGLYGMARHLRSGPSWRWYAAGFAAMGAGIITKGVGFLPLFVLLPWAWAAWKQWPDVTRERSWKWALGPVVLVFVVGLWLAPMLATVEAADDPELTAYRDEILFKQTAGRYASSWDHLRAPWYFVVNVIPPLWLPLSIALPWLLVRWRRSLKERDLRILLLCGWALAILLFFSASPGKRGVYILPALPAIALAAAPWLTEIWNRRWVNRAAFVLAAAFVATLAGFALYAGVLDSARLERLSQEYGRMPIGALALAAGIGTIWLLVFRIRRGLVAFAAILGTAWMILGLIVAPLLDPVRSGHALMNALEARLAPGERVGLVGWKEQFLLYFDEPVTVFGHRRFDAHQELFDAVSWLERGENRKLFLRDEARSECFSGRGELVGHAHREDWYLVSRADLEPQCRGRGSAGAARVYDSPVEHEDLE
ncbi:MAG TPA: glycosyltransferase family 39 protein [Thermoanaerobaculia bacterium]|nr:glycosyltransferase family 39 protein [Thermoanaerobaculia bacterium]